MLPCYSRPPSYKSSGLVDDHASSILSSTENPNVTEIPPSETRGCWKKFSSGVHKSVHGTGTFLQAAGRFILRAWLGFWKFLGSCFCGVMDCLGAICSCICSKPYLTLLTIIVLLFVVIGVPIIVVKTKHNRPPSVPDGWEAHYDMGFKAWYVLTPPRPILPENEKQKPTNQELCQSRRRKRSMVQPKKENTRCARWLGNTMGR